MAVFSSDHFWGYDPFCEIQCDWASGSHFSHYVKLAIFTTVPATPSAIYFNACGAESRESEHSRILILEDAAQALLNSVTCPNLQWYVFAGGIGKGKQHQQHLYNSVHCSCVSQLSMANGNAVCSQNKPVLLFTCKRPEKYCSSG